MAPSIVIIGATLNCYHRILVAIHHVLRNDYIRESVILQFITCSFISLLGHMHEHILFFFKLSFISISIFIDQLLLSSYREKNKWHIFNLPSLFITYRLNYYYYCEELIDGMYRIFAFEFDCFIVYGIITPY